jgi:hypothetical protein
MVVPSGRSLGSWENQTRRKTKVQCPGILAQGAVRQDGIATRAEAAKIKWDEDTELLHV